MTAYFWGCTAYFLLRSLAGLLCLAFPKLNGNPNPTTTNSLTVLSSLIFLASAVADFVGESQ